jgi:hypothetical protein
VSFETGKTIPPVRGLALGAKRTSKFPEIGAQVRVTLELFTSIILNEVGTAHICALVEKTLIMKRQTTEKNFVIRIS